MTETIDKLTRPSVVSLDEVLGDKFAVLDDGFVRVIDYMGSDESIVQAARVSYGAGTKKVHEDRGLIRYLMRHRHTSPFEMCEIKLHLRVPMDCWRQWIRHRTANVNEYSTRYSKAIDAAQSTSPAKWRVQAISNKQGSGEYLSNEAGERLTESETELQEKAREIYNARLEAGVAREQARKDLPLSTYTAAYWKIDLRNLLNFLLLRLDPHAQFEIRSYANVIANEIVSRWCPLAFEAFNDYWLNSVTFTRIERDILSLITANRNEDAIRLAEESGWLIQDDSNVKRTREMQEFEVKLKGVGLQAPWKT